MNIDLSRSGATFKNRHIGPSSNEVQEMLTAVKAESIEQLVKETIPSDIRMNEDLQLPIAKSEQEYLDHMGQIMSKNKIFKSYIGMGYYNTYTPTVIQRNILENPGWYTAYTPYQAEIAQGRLEALVNFQTMIIDLAGMEIANASLLDEGTAAAEAMSMLFSKKPKSKKTASTFFIDQETFPQTIDILKTRADGFGIQLEIGNVNHLDYSDPSIFGIYIQNPNNKGEVRILEDIIENAHQNEMQVIVGADLLSLALMTSPGSQGADIVVGSSQRFGVPLGYGGPHAAFIAAREGHKRQMPGRIIGRSQDKHGDIAYRMALQTREQHIRREKATSNICTAQVLLAVMAGMYGVYHGPEGLKDIASRTCAQAHILSQELENLGYQQLNANFFDTLLIQVDDITPIRERAVSSQMNFRYFEAENQIGISIDETTSIEDIEDILKVFALNDGMGVIDLQWKHEPIDFQVSWPEALQRKEAFMTHDVFHKYHSEHEMLRYMKRLENKDLSLAHSMISLGSCTMKLNATAEMIPVTWNEVGNLHPFVPLDQALGYQQMLSELESWLSEITGFDAVSLQPNSGAQGEYAGLMCIRSFHLANNDGHRNIALIPSSAHGTNPASAIMAGMKVVIVKCDEQGNIDLEDLAAKAEKYSQDLSVLMITYPSTHGVFEVEIRKICEIIHSHGGQVYMDGANMNAQVGLTSPGLIGADVCHLNLHKTFCIPHGGGGPGVGPIGVAKHLTPHLPGHHAMSDSTGNYNMPVSAAPYGSASICAISYGYIAMMGPIGLRHATETAILNANYILARLSGHYQVLYTGENNRCAHELIIDCRDFKKSGIEVQDIAKRLMDYGYHAPTVSFPVPGTMMIEPTESETKEEIDRFCDAMITIRKEIQDIISGVAHAEDNLLLNAPHTAAELTNTSWDHPYSREQACYPLPYVREQKFWPTVGRIDNAFGDRNLMCTCAPIESYEETSTEPQLTEV